MLYDRELILDLMNMARLYHASDMLRDKLMEVLDRHIPHLDEGCKVRGCACYDPRDNNESKKS